MQLIAGIFDYEYAIFLDFALNWVVNVTYRMKFVDSMVD